MVPASLIFVIVPLVLCAIGGMAIGALSGWLISLITKCGTRGIGRDALLGSVGFLVGFIGTIYMPWHQNTITERFGGGSTVTTTVTTTMNTYQHPERVAVVIAVLLPLLHELYRFWRTRTAQR